MAYTIRITGSYYGAREGPVKHVEPQFANAADWPPTRYILELYQIPREERSLPLRYASGAVITLSAILITLAAWPITQYNPLLFPFAAVLISAWYGGLGPGLCSAVLSAFIGAAYFDVPQPSLRFALLSGLLQVGVFALTSTLVSIRFGAVHEASRRAAREARLREEADNRAAELEQEMRTSRNELRSLRHRFGTLEASSELLTSTLNYQTVLESLGRQAVSGLAQWCVVDMYGVGNEVHRLMVAHRDADRQTLAENLYSFAPDPRSNHPVARVLYSGQPEIADSEGIEALLANLPQEERTVVEELGLTSYMIVPLISRGKILGAVTLAAAEPGYLYRPEELTLAQDLAYRAALAIDNARLYRAAQEELADRRQAQAALSRQQARINALNARLQRAMTETHHRVKNNLQIVAAMIEMRLFDAGDTVPAEELRRLASYVLTLAAVHDILTGQAKEDGEAEFVSARAVLHKLLDLMHHTATTARLDWIIDEAMLPVRKGTSLALLANELVSNAFKHGQGDVLVTFTVDQDEATLRVRDSGPGFPPDFNPLQAANTGLELVESLSRSDLEGATAYGCAEDSGGLVTITFPVHHTE